MNNAQLRVRINSLQTNHTQDGTLTISGDSSFKYYDRGGFKVRSLRFQAYGEAAVTLNQGGVGAVHVLSGRLNIFKPNDTHPNHQMLLTVERTVIVGESTDFQSTSASAEVPASESVPTVTNTQSVPVPTTSNGKATADYSAIPF